MQQSPEGWQIMSWVHDPMDALLLAETLAVRLCHDMAGQVNALTGAMEVLREEADPEALALAGDAADMLARRLRLARIAWGPAGSPMAVEEWCRLAEGLRRRGVSIDLDGVDPGSHFTPAAARLSLNVLLLAAEALPAGGLIEAAGQPDQDIVVRIRGPRAAWPAGLAAMLAEPDAAWQSLRQADPTTLSRALQAPLTALIAQAEGLSVRLLMGAQAEAAPPLLVTLAPNA